MKIFLLLLIAVTSVHATETRKNVLFILVDDLGVTDLNLDGQGKFYETPNLEKFAQSAVTFTNGYASCPVCSPTRSAIMTGQNPARTKNTDYFGAPHEFLTEIPANYNPTVDLKMRDKTLLKSWKGEKIRDEFPLLPAPYMGFLAASHETLPEAFLKNGYQTFFAGKWHLGHEGSYPEDHGFQINQGGNHQGGPYTGNKYFSPYGNPNLKDGPVGEHLTERLARETANFIRANKDKPFFAYLSFYSVHTPIMTRPDLKVKYTAKRKKLGLSDQFLPEPPRQNRAIQSHATYAGMIEAMDQAIGHVLGTLEKEGLAENTIVIVTSDNGGLSTSEGSPTSNLPFRAGKGWLYEGGIRVPVIIRDPATESGGQKSAALVSSVDYFPTLLEACHLETMPEQHLDGRSILAAVKNPSEILPKDGHSIIWHYPHWGNQGGSPGTAIRKGNWKLIRWEYPKRDELYHLGNDLGEQKNLIHQEQKIATSLKEEINQFLKKSQAKTITKNSNFDATKFKKW